jgi:O-antigen/teichoic acid export membrane protein
MLVSLYTVRVVLETLGAEDYGIYNVVGGVVMMFSFLSNSMASASQRYFSFELGRGDSKQLKRTFSLSFLIYALIALIVLLLAETIGLWFVNHKLIIPLERMGAVRWIYQFSIISFVFSIMVSPFMAAIIAHEDMNIYAVVSIMEAVLRLGIVFLLKIIELDKLRLYGILLCTVTVINTGIYRTICKLKYQECKFSIYWNKELFREIVNYTGWNVFGNISSVCKNYGISILLNQFFNPVIIAAYTISLSINTALNSFSANFIMAVNPQIIKRYAVNKKKEMFNLMVKCSKYIYFLVYAISLPFIFEMNFVLNLWLKNVPEYTVLFSQLIVIDSIIASISYPLGAGINATGNIGLYQGVIGGLLILNLPLSYAAIQFFNKPYMVFLVSILVTIMAFIGRLIFLYVQLAFPVSKYIIEVVSKMCIFSLILFGVDFLIKKNMQENIVRFIIIFLVTIFMSIINIFVFGSDRDEKSKILMVVKDTFRLKKMLSGE